MATSAQGVASCSGVAYPVVTQLQGSVYVAPHKAIGSFQTPNLILNDPACDSILFTLLAANWTMLPPIQATASIFAPFGWGYVGPVVFVGASSGVVYVYYDPTTGPPPSGNIGAYVIIPVPTGSTGAISQGNLVAELNMGGLGFTAVISSSTSIAITANAPGTAGDGIVLSGTGARYIANTTSGGGWVVQSRSQFDMYGTGNATRIKLTITTGAPGVPTRLYLTAEINSVSVSFPAQASGQWFVMADDFQAVFVSQAPFGAGDIFVFNDFLWIATAYVPGGVPVSDAAWISQNANRPSVSGTGSGGLQVDMFLNGSHTVATQEQQGWSLGMFHVEQSTNEDPLGQALIQPPYVFLYDPGVSQSRIVGYVWDSFLTSIPQPMLQQFNQANDQYRVIATQSIAQEGSLLLMTAEIDNVGTPASQNPPVTNPTSAVGLGDVGFVSPTTGDLSQTSGTASFSVSWVGDPIQIDGATYTITAVPSTTVLQFQPPPPSALLQVPWSFNQ